LIEYQGRLVDCILFVLLSLVNPSFHKMTSLPANLDFPAMESKICDEWKENDTFQTQNKLSLERNDEVCV
jgi:hypothetical protein